MTLGTQKKLLRVLQEREFERVGGSITVKIDTRVIAATNKDLPVEISEGRFREDLFYRLNMISIHLPPLRERKDDIPLLVEHFLHQERFSPGSKPSRISQAALDRLVRYDWPGNVRELANVVGRAVILAQGGVIGEQHLDFAAAQAQRYVNVGQRVREGVGMIALLEMVERQAIAEALALNQGELASAAESLKMPLRDLKKRMEALGLVD
jgi:two-component system response regulator AtoC